MPSLKEVVEIFQTGFHYLNADKQRQTQWYQIWYKNSALKNKWTKEPLTTAKENAAKTFEQELETLILTHGNEDFSSNQAAFFSVIANVLKTVRVQRFAHGTIETETYNSDEHAIFERNLVPQKSGNFEQQLLNGLGKIKASFPELSKIIDNAIEKIQQSELQNTQLLREDMKTFCNGQKFYSANPLKTNQNLYTPKGREDYANETVPLVFC
ncbi:hypothetical protein [Legionella micdadei]|uniref:hypothetical protein n=1 Tax=Legionella micdadei TaxID=451 RepID=UPI0009EF709E|nr:hypothetical protein [Legionella micdadei]ARG99492.1 hypothetical protein B6V88_03150 [Legionella micdadei]